MKIIAKKNRELLLINASNTQNENKAETIELTVPEKYEDYNKKIAFVTDNGIVWDIIRDNKYKLTKAITKYNQVDFYIWLTKGDVDFRTETKTLRFYHNEDASDEITPEEISGVNTVINILEEEITKVDGLETELNGIIEDLQHKLDTGYFKGEKGDAGEPGQNGTDGHDGQDGQDAKINGVNTLTIEAGSNINLEQEGNTLTISSTGGGSGGTSNYNDLTNKPSINNVTLTGNKSLNDLGIQAAGNYITNEADPTVPSYVKNITQSNINSWNNKSDFSGNYNDLTNRPTIPAEVTENTVSGWGFTKNTGTYSKPVNGIPKTDLETSVQTSLDKADTALQAHQDISGKLNTNKVKNTQSTVAGDVYDVRYINSVLGDISTVLSSIVTVGGGN